MVHKIDISPEVAKLARRRAQSVGAVNNELARAVAVEEIIVADPQASLLIDEEAAYSSSDALVGAFDVNDIVVNGIRLDVRAVDDEGRISLHRSLIGTSYMTAGTLAVVMTGSLSGKVIGFVDASQWHTADRSAGDEQVLSIKAPHEDNFDVAARIPSITASGAHAVRGEQPKTFELAVLVTSREQLPLQKQRAFIEYVLGSKELWEQLFTLVNSWSSAPMKRVLSDASVWNARVQKICRVVAPKFQHLSNDAVNKVVTEIGETSGGQPESPAFRKLLLTTLSREELAHSLGGALLKKACDVAESVISGRALADAVKDAVPNKVAVQIATQIKQQRSKVSHFVDATAQELSAAFQQLAMQPAYATHSKDPSSGVESINEALKLMDAGELAQTVKELDTALADL
jgi:hypothetical protein